jgi:hypothetical protein
MSRVLAACVVCVLAAPGEAAAEWHITPMLGVTFAGRTTLHDFQQAADKRHANVGGAVTLLGSGVFGAEALVVFTPGFFQTARTPLDTDVARVELKSSRTLAVMGNAVLTTPRRWTEYSLRPFVSGGFGVLHSSETFQTTINGIELLPVHAGIAAFDIGGGAVGFLSARTGVRFDLRYYSTVRPTDRGDMAIGLARLHYMTASVGLVFRR